MPHPEWLFHKAQIQTIKFTDIAGDFNADRMTQGYSDWFEIPVYESKQKNVLVLEDFTARGWSPTKKVEVKQKLLSLISQGFELYVYQEPQASEPLQSPLLKLSIDNIDLLDTFRFSIPPVKKSVVIDLLKEKNIPADHIAHLDVFHLKELLGHDFSGVQISELVRSLHPVKTLKEHLSSEMPEVTLFNDVAHFTRSNDSKQYVAALEEFNKSFKITEQIKTIHYDATEDREENNLGSALEKNALLLENLNLSSGSFDPYDPDNPSQLDSLDPKFISEMKNLQELNASKSRIPVNVLISILENNLNLKFIDLFGCKAFRLSDKISLPHLALKKLETLNVCKSTIKKDLLLSILESAENLKTLDLSFLFERFDSKKKPPELTLTREDILKCSLLHLEKLILFGTYIESNAFSAFLEKASNLKELQVQIFLHDNLLSSLTPQDIPTSSLSKLEKLIFSEWSAAPKEECGPGLNPKTLTAILEQTDNLKELSIKMENKDFTIDTIPTKTLNSLKTISLDTSLEPDSIAIVLEKMTNLEELRLSEASTLQPKHLPIAVLQKLKDLSLNKLTPDLCIHILKYAINLNPSKRANFERELQKLEREANEKMEKRRQEAMKPMILDPNTENSDAVDANTNHNKKTEFNIRQIFKGIGCKDPDTILYRLKTFDRVEIRNDPNEPFLLHNSPFENTLAPCNPEIKVFDPTHPIEHQEGFQHYEGKISVLLSQQWQRLPSLSSNEILTHLRMTGATGELKDDLFEIQYSSRDNFYYIRLKSDPGQYVVPKEVNVEFLLKVPVSPTVQTMPPKIQALIEKYYHYGKGDLQVSTNATGEERLKAIQTQIPGVGACRHRSIAFKKEVEEDESLKDYPVRIINNQSHSFVEIKNASGSWIGTDLGGYESNSLVFDENGNSVVEQLETKADADKIVSKKELIKSVPPEIEKNLEKKILQEKPKTTSLATHKETKKDISPLVPEIISEKDIEHSRFKSWLTHEKMAAKKALKSYIRDIAEGTSPITNDPLKKILVKLESKEATEGFRLLVQKQMLSLGKQVYYIDSPDDLVCSAPWIERNLETNIGIIRKPTEPPGNKLREFLNANHPHPVLVVNWSNFKAADIVKFNSLLDTNRKVDGVDIPENTLIVGLHTEKPGAYNGEDFFSRFDSVITFPFEEKELILRTKEKDLQESTHSTIEQKTDEKERVIIDLYSSPQWKGILLGKWCLQGKNLVFKEGALSKALKTGKELEFKNAPWHLEEFKTFWQQARLHQKIDAYGKEITLPPGFKVYSSEGYEWDMLLANTRWSPISLTPAPADSETYLLNPSTFNQYFKNYQSVPGDQLDLRAGWLKKAALQEKSSLSLLLTRELSAHQWGQLLKSAKKHNIKLNIQVAPGVSLPENFPEALKKLITAAPAETKVAASLETIITSLEKLENKKGHVLLTEDIDYAIATLKDRYPKEQQPTLDAIKIIDISECEARHLLVSTTPHFNKETLDYKFVQKISPVWEALEKGETVVLKGHFKEELIDALAPLCSHAPHFWLNGERHALKGKLVLVTDNKEDSQKYFNFTSTTTVPTAKNIAELLALLKRDAERRYQKIFSPADIQSAIEKLPNNAESQKYPFVKWQSLLEHQLCYPDKNPDDNWQGLRTLDESRENVIDEKLTFDGEAAEIESAAFDQKRLNQINNALKIRPFVFVAGSTGVGKSTFIKQKLKAHPDYKVFFEDQLTDWATDKTPGLKKTLFIDEANINKGNFSQFEGLFETPPRILIGDTYHDLSSEHNVIFAGNPLSYGSRKMPELFERHGGSVIFTPLSPAYLYMETIKPILKDYFTEKTAKEEQTIVGQRLLEVYQYISRLSRETILISPRELQMMALLVVKKHQEKPPLSLDACISYAVHMIGTSVVPQKERENFTQWCTDQGFQKPTLPPPPPPFLQSGKEKSTSFVVTESRNPAYNQILDFLSIRALKQENTTNDTFKYAGLGGMIFEGEPGVGKSHFVVDTLISQGFKEAHWKPSDAELKTEPTKEAPQKIFYIMPVSMQLAEKKKLLLKAFDEGAVVLIDEINSSPMMEDLLNDLLMGIHGDKRPTHPGFMVIGTQNPISMEGRLAASTALERRFFKTIFTPYEPSEMEEILQNKGLNLENAKTIVEEFRITRKFAIENNKHPMPTFRDLLKIAGLSEKAHALKTNALDQTSLVIHLSETLETLTNHLAKTTPAEPLDVSVTLSFSNKLKIRVPKAENKPDNTSESSTSPDLE